MVWIGLTWDWGKTMNWQAQIPGCFGGANLIWASHPNDQARARLMFITAIAAGATMDQIVAEAEAYLQAQGALAAHIQAQVANIRGLII
jgi:hypothetical protein